MTTAGYLATTPEEYAVCLGAALDRYRDDPDGTAALRERARRAAAAYSDADFQANAMRVLLPLLTAHSNSV